MPRTAALAALLVAAAPAAAQPSARDRGDLAVRARDVLRRHCGECHGEQPRRGDVSVLDGRVDDGVFRSDTYPDALARVWAALECPTSGDILLSAAPGAEFADWGGADHVGGGSHGSLHFSDSLGALILTGVDGLEQREQWSIADVASQTLRHFQVASEA